MAKLTRIRRCYHCGEELQTSNPDEVGYIDEKALDKYDHFLLLCNNCYNTQRFSSSPKEANFDNQYLTILDEIQKKKSLVVYVIDLFSFEGSFISKITEKLRGLDVLVIANKRDLLPIKANDEQIIKYVEHRLKVLQLEIKDVVLTSTNPNMNIDLMYQKIYEYGHTRDVYFVGPSLSGKSALITEFLKIYNNPTVSFVRTITFEGTSLRGFAIPLDDKSYLYETPGTSTDNSIISKVEKPVQHLITPRKRVTEKRILLFKHQILFLGTLAAIRLESNKRVSISLYVSNKVETYTTKYKGNHTIDDAIRLKKAKPNTDIIKKSADFDVYNIEVTEEGSRDIGILGLGWFNFKGEQQIFRIYVPKGVFVFTTRAKI